MFCRARAKPIETIIMAINPVWRLRSGFQRAWSLTKPNAPDKHNAQDRCEDEGDSESDVQPPGDDGAEGDDFAVREVRQPGGAVDEREPNGSKRDDEAEAQTLDGQLGCLIPLAGEVALALAKGEENGTDRASHFDAFDGVLRRRRHAVGKSLLIEFDRVGAWSRDLDLPSAHVVAGADSRETFGVGCGHVDTGYRVTGQVTEETLDRSGSVRRQPPVPHLPAPWLRRVCRRRRRRVRQGG